MKLLCCLLSLMGWMSPCFSRGMYLNPVGGGIEVADPFVLREGGIYYLYGTTDSGSGFRAWKSDNLVDWQPIGWVFRKSEETWGQKSFWAPEVIHYGERFYMVYSSHGQTQFGEGMRICLAVAETPEGPFHELYAPWLDFGYSAIDGHIYVEEGKPYLYFEMVGAVGDLSQQQGFMWGVVFGVQLAQDLSGPVSEPKLCLYPSQAWEGIDSFWARSNEGMTVFKRGGTYYMTYSGNHWADPNYGIGYATSDRPLGGLWTKHEWNPILERNLGLGISGPGHNSIVSSPDGSEMFIVYHTHRDVERPQEGRVLNMDRLVFGEDGRLQVIGPTRTPQPMPSGAEKAGSNGPIEGGRFEAEIRAF